MVPGGGRTTVDLIRPVKRVLGAPVRRRRRRREANDDAQLRAAVLARFLPPGGVGAEIGVYKGHLSGHLLTALQPTVLHLIDPWYLVGETWNWGADPSTVDALVGVIRRYATELAKGQVVLHVGWDLEVLDTFPDATFDWVYLDTTHNYEQTRHELKLLQQKVKPGHLIAGDDYRPDPTHPHHGVYRAVHEFIAETGFELLYGEGDDRQWVVRARTS